MAKKLNILVILLCTLCVLPAAAQKNARAVQAALAILINRHSTKADTIAIELSERFAKDAAMQTALARAYFRNNEREKTRMYLNKAITADSTYSEAFDLKGLSYGTYDKDKHEYVLYPQDVDSACYWFDKAIAKNPTSADAYIHYADAQTWKDMDAAVAKMAQLKEALPDYNTDILIADLWQKRIQRASTAEEIQEARANLNNTMTSLDPYKLTHNQLSEFAVQAYLEQHFDRSLELSMIGINRFPEKKDYHRVVAWSAASLQQYKEALEHATTFIDATPKDSVWSIDYWAQGIGYLGTNKLDMAFDLFRQTASMDDRFASALPSWTNKSVEVLVDSYKQQGLYDDAAALYAKYNKEYPSTSDPAYRLYKLADIYKDAQKDLEGEFKKPWLQKMFAVYDELENTYPDWDNMHYVLYTHARYTYSYLDSDNSQQLAEPYYKKLYDFVNKKSDPSDQMRNMQVEACQYMASTAYFVRHDLKTARVWWNKILDIDPLNEMAAKALATIKK